MSARGCGFDILTLFFLHRDRGLYNTSVLCRVAHAWRASPSSEQKTPLTPFPPPTMILFIFVFSCHCPLPTPPHHPIFSPFPFLVLNGIDLFTGLIAILKGDLSVCPAVQVSYLSFPILHRSTALSRLGPFKVHFPLKL